MKQNDKPSQPGIGDAITIGGQEVIELRRESSGDGERPEFLSATVLPGRGMNLFQITARVPGKGIIDVLASPSLQEAAEQLNGGPNDIGGVRSFAFGGAFLVPYPNRILGKLTPDGKNIVTSWQGRELTLPAVWKGKNPGAQLHAIHGLILNRKTDRLDVASIADGQSVTGILHAGDFGGHWPSKTDLSITVALTGDAITAFIEATNVGTEPEPMGIGWHPYFSIPSGDRTQTTLQIPASKLAQVNNYDDVFPTGKLIDVKGTSYDFASEPRALGNIFLDDNFSQLTRQNGAVVVKLADPAAHYGIQIEGLSPEIKTVQVYARPDKVFVAIEEQFNYADPFSPKWGTLDTGMVTLAPGESVTWEVRLRLFTPAD